MNANMLAGRVALITGGSRGIGAAIARLFSHYQASVIINYHVNQDAAEQLVRSIEQGGGAAIAVKADVTDRGQVADMVRAGQEAFGAIDTLVLNANLPFRAAPVTSLEWEDIEQKISDELKAAFFCCREVVPAMMAQKRGCILAISSGLSQAPVPGTSVLGMAKASLDSYIRSLAIELGPYGIRANTIAPGFTLTDATEGLSEELKRRNAQLTPLQRNATPQDVAGIALMLAAETARFVTGAYVPVDGGAGLV